MNISRLSISKGYDDLYNKMEQLSVPQKLVSIIALTIFPYFLYYSFKLIKKLSDRRICNEEMRPNQLSPISPIDLFPIGIKPDLQGSLKGKITFSPDEILSIEGNNLKLDCRGVLTGVAKAEKDGAIYEGEFERGAFNSGTIKLSLLGDLYQYDIKDGAATKCVKNNEIPVDETTSQMILFNHTLIFGHNYPHFNFQFEGYFKGIATFNKNPVQVEMKDLRVTENGALLGLGKVVVNGKAYEVDSRSGNNKYTYIGNQLLS
ncbi:MAG: hypothetical protein H0W88_11565 [Parachlamydiaceae bacterium]|nr:hypothetical protein [Parachlamydiaceae bacterium]